MNILAEIHRAEGINIHGKTIHRSAVRAVICRGRELLMVYSANVGDYKFPGGGVGAGESHAQALEREVLEECGAALARMGEEIGAVIEYNLPVEADFDVFKMTSQYYFCEVVDGFGLQKLDDYEKNLGFKPQWVDVGEAIRINKVLMNSNNRPEWLRREIFVLEHLERMLTDK